jgi:hypothetical protein
MWTGAAGSASQIKVDPSHLKRDRRTLTVEVPSNILFGTVSSIGGRNGWYFADWLWKLRGFIDKQVGGVGLRRGRRDPIKTSVGEALDFWRVEDYVEDKLIRLKAEMKVGGHAWLEFEMEDVGPARSRLIQTAEFYPRGLFGLLYWYTIYPVHVIVFRGLSRAIGQRARKKFLSAEDRNLGSGGYIP